MHAATPGFWPRPVADANNYLDQNITKWQNVEVNALNNVRVSGAGLGPMKLEISPSKWAQAGPMLCRTRAGGVILLRNEVSPRQENGSHGVWTGETHVQPPDKVTSAQSAANPLELMGYAYIEESATLSRRKGIQTDTIIVLLAWASSSRTPDSATRALVSSTGDVLSAKNRLLAMIVDRWARSRGSWASRRCSWAHRTSKNPAITATRISARFPCSSANAAARPRSAARVRGPFPP